MAVTNQIQLYTAASTIDGANDYLLEYQNSSSAYRKINRNTLLGVSGQPADISTVQTFTNKTLTTPTISAPVMSGTVTGTYTLGGTPTFPATVVITAGTQTLTNKTLTSPTITGGTIDNSTITVDSISGHTTPTIVTVGGVQMNNGTIGTAGAVTSTSVAVGAIQPQALTAGTGTGWVLQAYTPTLTNIVVGTGGASINAARYIQVGKMVTYRGTVFLGASGASVTGSIVISLPVTASTAAGQTSGVTNVGYATLVKNAVNQFGAFVYLASTTTMALQPIDSSGAYGVITANANATIPFTWAAGDGLFFSITYEAA